MVANGLVLVNSGYTRYGGIAGNVLIAFAPRSQAAGPRATEPPESPNISRVSQNLMPEFPL